MIITATEFKTNIGKYLSMAGLQDIIITKNGKNVAKLTNARDSTLNALHSMRGILRGAELTLSDIRAERLSKYDEAVD